MSDFIYYYANCHYAECCDGECHYAECRYAECRSALDVSVKSHSCVQFLSLPLTEIVGHMERGELEFQHLSFLDIHVTYHKI